MGFPIKFDTVRSGWAIVYIEGLHMIQIVRKKAKISTRYNQAPHPTRTPYGKVTKTQENIHMSIFPAGDHKAARYGKDNMENTQQKKHHLGMVSKKITGGLKHV